MKNRYHTVNYFQHSFC